MRDSIVARRGRHRRVGAALGIGLPAFDLGRPLDALFMSSGQERSTKRARDLVT